MAETLILLAVKKIGTALGNEVINQATSFFKEFVTQLTELQGSMGRMRRELRLMHEFLTRTDIRHRNNRNYEIWVEEVRMLVHRIEDIVDDYMHLVAHKEEGWGTYLKRGFNRPSVLLSLKRIASSVKEAEANLVHLFQAKERWAWMVTSGECSGHIFETSRHLASMSRCLDEQDLVGVDENREILHEWLAGDELQREVIVLHGMGGLGKTALAANVYKNQREKFECHAWISISQTYSIKDILKCLIIELFRDDQTNAPSNIENMGIEGLQDELKMFLRDRRYLVILDDVWAPEAVNHLLMALVPNHKGSRVLVTTRNDDVAHLVLPEKRITLERLTNNESWELFCKTAFPRAKTYGCPSELTQLAAQIVNKCNGIPLAIVSVGRLLFVRDKNKKEFRRIHNQLEWELINNPSLQHVRNILYLSYIYLPTNLKSCFLYCSLYPEDYLFKRKKLMQLWIAEGFIEKRGIRTMEEVAEKYINELVQWNMLQLVERNSLGRIKSFRMHDIIRELAVDLCRRECFGVTYSDEDKYGGSLEEKNGRRMVIHRLNNHSSQAISSANHLRTLIAFDNRMPSYNLLTLATKCKYMSVLELSGLPIEKVPRAIGGLYNLQHLGLRNSKVKLLPDCIERLTNLVTLDLQGSKIQELPRGIVKLKKLRHLFAERVSDKYWRKFRCRSGVPTPRGLEEMRELHTLQAVEVRGERSVWCLGALRQIRSIRIWGVKRSYCECLCESLRKMEFLSNLSITASDEEEILHLNDLNPLPPNLETLSLGGRLAQADLLLGAATADGQNHPLCSVLLYWSQQEEDPLESLSRWSNLTKLVLTRAYVGVQLVFLQGWFPSLKELSLRDMPHLTQLNIHQGTMTSLQQLRLVNLRRMTEVPLGIEFLVTTLNYLAFREITADFFKVLRYCPRICGIKWWYSLLREDFEEGEGHLSESDVYLSESLSESDMCLSESFSESDMYFSESDMHPKEFDGEAGYLFQRMNRSEYYDTSQHRHGIKTVRHDDSSSRSGTDMTGRE